MKWLQIGMKLLPDIVSAVKSVERFFTSGKGKAKEDAAIASVAGILDIVEIGTDREILYDEKVADAVRDVMRAVVSLQNIIEDVHNR